MLTCVWLDSPPENSTDPPVAPIPNVRVVSFELITRTEFVLPPTERSFVLTVLRYDTILFVPRISRRPDTAPPSTTSSAFELPPKPIATLPARNIDPFPVTTPTFVRPLLLAAKPDKIATPPLVTIKRLFVPDCAKD